MNDFAPFTEGRIAREMWIFAARLQKSIWQNLNSPIVRIAPSSCPRFRRPIVIRVAARTGARDRTTATCQSFLVVELRPLWSYDCTTVSSVDSLCWRSFLFVFTRRQWIFNFLLFLCEKFHASKLISNTHTSHVELWWGTFSINFCWKID